MKKTIAVLFGGCSSEYQVSLKSAYAVLTNLDKEKYEIISIGITKSGDFKRYYGSYSSIEDDTWHKDPSICTDIAISPNRSDSGFVEFQNGEIEIVNVDAVFPILHGRNGEDGTIQGMMELSGIPIVGCNTLSSALCMDKHRAHLLVKNSGIDVVDAFVINSKQFNEAQIINQAKNLTYPLFVKPVRSGSSFGITKVTAEHDLIRAVKFALEHDDDVIVEENVDGFEVGCAVMGTNEFITGKIDEIELSDGFFDFVEKYTLQTSKIHMPARIDKKTEAKIKSTAISIYKILGCSVFARVDMFLTKDKRIFFNEVNTIPGFTSHSRYPNMMKGIGISFGDLLDKLIGQCV